MSVRWSTAALSPWTTVSHAARRRTRHCLRLLCTLRCGAHVARAPPRAGSAPVRSHRCNAFGATLSCNAFGATFSCNAFTFRSRSEGASRLARQRAGTVRHWPVLGGTGRYCAVLWACQVAHYGMMTFVPEVPPVAAPSRACARRCRMGVRPMMLRFFCFSFSSPSCSSASEYYQSTSEYQSTEPQSSVGRRVLCVTLRRRLRWGTLRVSLARGA
jgi:hypothetical protein